MRPSEIRTELLQQHEQLRTLMKEVRGSLEKTRSGEAIASLNLTLSRLVEALIAHNRREEELLKDIIPTVDAWGPARAEIMGEEHVKEHKELWEALKLPETKEQLRGVETALDRVTEHMQREEKSFLGEDVLRDDIIIGDHFGG